MSAVDAVCIRCGRKASVPESAFCHYERRRIFGRVLMCWIRKTSPRGASLWYRNSWMDFPHIVWFACPECHESHGVECWNLAEADLRQRKALVVTP